MAEYGKPQNNKDTSMVSGTANRWVSRKVAISVGTAVALGAAWAVIGLASSASFKPFLLGGSLILSSESGVGGGLNREPGSFCQGVEGYGDISGSTPVNVLDDKGDVVGIATLSDGRMYANTYTCRFEFAVPIKKKSSTYYVEIPGRGRFDVPEARARAESIELSLN